MPRRKDARDRSQDERLTDELSYEEISGSGARPPGVGERRNVAAGAYENEPEDYDEQNRRHVGGRGGRGIQTGNYEEDYGPGVRGARNPGFDAEPTPEDAAGVLRRKKDAQASQDFPTGAWAAQRAKARLRKAKSGKVRARSATGRGVGVSPRRTSRKTSPTPSKTKRNRK